MKSTVYKFISCFILFCTLVFTSCYYSQSITTGTLSTTIICKGNSLSVNFFTTGSFQVGGSFKLELSNPTGSFNSNNYIGELVLDNSSVDNNASRTITGEIQSSTLTGNAYRVRVVFLRVDNNTLIIGNKNNQNIRIVPSELTPSFSLPTSICSGTNLALPTRSNNSITGTWSPDFNNTQTTTYTFTPTSGLCAKSVTRTITVNAIVTPAFSLPASICSGTNLILPTTSTNSITGTWSPAFDNTQTTNYTFTPTTGLCANTITKIIIVNENVVPIFDSIAPICSGEIMNALPLQSLNNISGTWSPELNNLQTTTYTFTPHNNHCATTKTKTLVVHPYVTNDTIVEACQTYTWPLNGQTYTASGNYTYVTECNETVLHLTISQSVELITPDFLSAVQTGLCLAGNTNPAYSISAVSEATSYLWIAPEGTTIESGQGTTSLTLNVTPNFTSGLLSVVAINSCTISPERKISIFSVLPTPGLIIGEKIGLCTQGLSSTTYSVPTFTGASDYLWTTPDGTEILSGQYSNIINLNFTSSFTSGNLSVEARNACGSSPKRTVALNSLTLTPGLITGTSHGLGTNGITTATYSIPNTVGATDYLWTIPIGTEIVSGQGTTSIILNFTSSFTSGNLTVEARNACGSSPKRTLSLLSVPLTPGTITGTTNSLCPSDVNNPTYSIAPVAGASSYTWTVPTGTTIVSGQGTTSITLNISSSFVSGTLSVVANNSCGASTSRTLALSSTPVTPGIISGTTTNLCLNSVANATYTIAAVTSALSYTWTAPSGTTIVSGQGTNSITLSISGSFVSGALRVVTNNACGSSAQRTLNLTSIPSTPGTITGTTNNLCPSGVSNPTYTIAAVAGASSYTWTAPAGTTIISGQGTTSVILDISSSFTSGTLRVVANNACTTSVVKTLSLTNTPPLTPASITGSTTPCGIVTYTCPTVAQAVSYTWTVPIGMEIEAGQGTDTITVNVIASSVTGNISVRASNNCKIGNARSLAVNSCIISSRMAETLNIQSINEFELVVFPNPTNDKINVQLSKEFEENVKIEIINLIGQKVAEFEIQKGNTNVSKTLEGMPSGIYLLQASKLDGTLIYTTKILKQ